MKALNTLALSLALNACSSTPKLPSQATKTQSLRFSEFVSEETQAECISLPWKLKQILINQNVLIRSIYEQKFQENIERRRRERESNKPERFLINFENVSDGFDLFGADFEIFNINNIYKKDNQPVIYVGGELDCIESSVSYYLDSKISMISPSEKLDIISYQLNHNFSLPISDLVLLHVEFVIESFNEMGVRGNINEESIHPGIIVAFEKTLENLQILTEIILSKGENFPVNIETEIFDKIIIGLYFNLSRLDEIAKIVMSFGETQEFKNNFLEKITWFETEINFSIASTRFETIENQALQYLINQNTLDRKLYRNGFAQEVLEFFQTKHPEFK